MTESNEPAPSTVKLDSVEASQASSASSKRLSSRSFAEGRYHLAGEIARGGMGAIVKVWDTDCAAISP